MASSKKASNVLKKSDSGTKRAKQGAMRHQNNVSLSTRLKTQEKKVIKAVVGEVEQAKKVFEALVSMLDKAVSKGVIHKNKAARKKSLFHQRVFANQTAVTKEEAAPKAPKKERATPKRTGTKGKSTAKSKAKK